MARASWGPWDSGFSMLLFAVLPATVSVGKSDRAFHQLELARAFKQMDRVYRLISNTEVDRLIKHIFARIMHIVK